MSKACKTKTVLIIAGSFVTFLVLVVLFVEAFWKSYLHSRGWW